MRLLIIAEDGQLTKKLEQCLSESALNIDTAPAYSKGLFWAKTNDYDLIIIEYRPNENSVQLCQSIREKGKTMPILIITESISGDEAVSLFNSGIDDYTSKFSSCSEISARVQALLRRPKVLVKDIYTFDDLIVDCRNYSVSRGESSIYLTKKEFGLLVYLLRYPNQVLSRTDLIEHVWDINADLFSNSLETHILNLRKKIEQPNKPKLIHTISGRGYKITVNIPS